MQQISDLYQQYLALGKISTDSRQDVSGSIFFALSGDNFNGNQFAADALKKGALLAVIDQKEFDKGDGYFLVEDTLKALQDLARMHQAKMPAKIIGLRVPMGKQQPKNLYRLFWLRKNR